MDSNKSKNQANVHEGKKPKFTRNRRSNIQIPLDNIVEYEYGEPCFAQLLFAKDKQLDKPQTDSDLTDKIPTAIEEKADVGERRFNINEFPPLGSKEELPKDSFIRQDPQKPSHKSEQISASKANLSEKQDNLSEGGFSLPMISEKQDNLPSGSSAFKPYLSQMPLANQIENNGQKDVGSNGSVKDSDFAKEGPHGARDSQKPDPTFVFTNGVNFLDDLAALLNNPVQWNANSAIKNGFTPEELGINFASRLPLYSKFRSSLSDQPINASSFPGDDYHISTLVRLKLPPIDVKAANECTLFYIFYNCGGDVLQVKASSELYLRDWRYSYQFRTWITQEFNNQYTLINNCLIGVFKIFNAYTFCYEYRFLRVCLNGLQRYENIAEHLDAAQKSANLRFRNFCS